MIPIIIDMIPRAFVGVLTLYMLLILVRWLGPYAEIDLYGRLRWIRRITDPTLNLARKILPTFGPVDFAPIATIFALWVIRQIGMLAFAVPNH